MKTFTFFFISIFIGILFPLQSLQAQLVNDLSLSTIRSTGIPANVYTPEGQLQKLYIRSVVENVGTLIQSDVFLDVQVQRIADNELFYSRSVEIGTLPPQQRVDTINWIATFSADHFPVGEYQMRYHVRSSATDITPENNTLLYPFSVTDSTFAKNTSASRNLRPADDLWEDGEAHNWSIGNYYFISEDSGNPDLLRATSITAEITNTADYPGYDILFWLYQWDDLNEDGIADLNQSSGEVLPVAFNSYTCQSSDPSPIKLTLPLIDFLIDDCPPFPCSPILRRNQAYIAAVQFTVADETENFFIEADDETNYTTNELIAFLNGEKYYTHALHIGVQPYFRLKTSAVLDSTHFGNQITPRIDLNINSDIVATIPALDADHLTRLFPLPAKDQLQLEIDLKSRSEEVRLSLFDLMGKKVLSQKHNQLKTATLPLKVDHLPPGSYFLHIHTDAGARVMKVVIGD